MSLAEILPEIRALTKDEKLKLLELLAEDLGQNASSLIVANGSYPVWSPEGAFSAADSMLTALREDGAAS